MSNLLIPVIAIGLAYSIYMIGCAIYWVYRKFKPEEILEDNDDE